MEDGLLEDPKVMESEASNHDVSTVSPLHPNLDLDKSLEKVEGASNESEVLGVKVKDDENLEQVNETKESTVMVEDQNKLDRKLDDSSQVVEKIDDDSSEVPEKEIFDNSKEKVTLDDIYALEGGGNDENELLEDLHQLQKLM